MYTLYWIGMDGRDRETELATIEDVRKHQTFLEERGAWGFSITDPDGEEVEPW